MGYLQPRLQQDHLLFKLSLLISTWVKSTLLLNIHCSRLSYFVFRWHVLSLNHLNSKGNLRINEVFCQEMSKVTLPVVDYMNRRCMFEIPTFDIYEIFGYMYTSFRIQINIQTISFKWWFSVGLLGFHSSV